jgi:hypothetical protein
MDVVTIGLLVSTFCVLALALLFRYEEKRGLRFLEHVRIRADFYVLKATAALHKLLNYTGRNFIRQVAHYLFHSLLRSVLDMLKRGEKSLRNAMRINKTLAKRAERESTTRTKLEEIALHKAANALTEDEKRLHKEKMLQGHPHQ